MLLGIPGTLVGTVASAFYFGMGRLDDPVNPKIEPATTVYTGENVTHQSIKSNLTAGNPGTKKGAHYKYSQDIIINA